MTQQPDIKIAVRVPAQLVSELREIAEQEDRTFSAEVRRLMRQRVAAERAEAQLA